jgi:ribose transport system permease protein
VGLALVLIVFSINPECRIHFLSATNLRTVAVQTVITGIAALGMTLIIVSAGIDLSMGSLLALSCTVLALLLNVPHMPVAVAILLCVLLGAGVGAINAGLITWLQVAPFIVTLGMLGAVRGTALWLGNNSEVDVAWTQSPTYWLGSVAALTPHPSWLIVAPGVWLMIALGFLTSFILKKTVFGRHIFAIGSNEVASRLSGLRVDLLKISIYATAGLFFGLAGVIQFARLSIGDPTVDVGAELDAIAAVVIGGGSLNGGEGSAFGSIIGALIMALLRNGSQLMGWPDYVQQIIIGLVIIAAVALDRLRHRAEGN